jgi:hypothetical protein
VCVRVDVPRKCAYMPPFTHTHTHTHTHLPYSRFSPLTPTACPAGHRCSWNTKTPCDGISEYQPRTGASSCLAATQCLSEFKAPTPTSDRICCRKDITVQYTAHNKGTIFIDGTRREEFYDFRTAHSMPSLTSSTVAIMGVYKNNGPAALLVVMDTRVSDASWRCTSTQPAPNWMRPGFDDSGWPQAVEHGSHGDEPWGPVDGITGTKAKWIWVADNNVAGSVWCRSPGKCVVVMGGGPLV